MDKDNLDFQYVLTSLTAEKLKSVQGEARQEVLTALCLMVVGLLLASVGLAGVLLRLGRLAGCNIYLLVARLLIYCLTGSRVKNLLWLNNFS